MQKHMREEHSSGAFFARLRESLRGGRRRRAQAANSDDSRVWGSYIPFIGGDSGSSSDCGSSDGSGGDDGGGCDGGGGGGGD